MQTNQKVEKNQKKEIQRKKKLNNKEHILLTKNQGKRSSCRTKTEYFKTNNCNSTKELKIVRKETNSKDSGQEDIKEIDINSEQEVKQKTEIINKIKMTRACIYLCFCCTRKRNIIQNILIDEGMSVISEQLDVFNIFDKLYRDEKIQEKLTKVKLIEMTEECKVRVKSIYNN